MPTTVTVFHAAAGDVAVEVMGAGTLEPRTRTTISPKIAGRLMEILADQNDQVKAGQVLARLDSTEISRQIDIAQASLNAGQATVERIKTDASRAKAVYEQAKRDYQRISGLAESKMASQSDVEKSQEKLFIAEADLSKSTAAITEAMLQVVTAQKTLQYHQALLLDANIISPFEGFVIRRDKEVGDVVVPGASVLQLISTQEMWISAWVDESAMADLSVGQPARIVFRSEPGKPYAGKVVRMGLEADRETREFLVDVHIVTLPKNWAVGQRAEAYIETARKTGVLTIPNRMVLWQNGKPGVYMALGGKAVWRNIELGIQGIEQVEVIKGLSPSDAIIDSTMKLFEGKRITIQ
jgi:HlyD family secretion protein